MHCDADPERAAQRGDAGDPVHPSSLRHADHRLGARDRGARPRGRARLLRALLHAGERDPDRRRRRRPGRGARPRRALLRPDPPARRRARSAAGRRSRRRSPAASSSSTTRRSSSRAGSAATSRPSYRTAAPGESDALEVLAHLLGGGQTSLLYRKLVLDEKKARRGRRLLHGLGARRHALLSSTRCPPPASRCRISTPRSIARSPAFIADGVDADELERAKTRLVAEAIYAQDSQSTLARWYGASLATGQTIRDVQEWPQRIEAVTRRGRARRRAQMARSAPRRHRLSAADRTTDGGLRPPTQSRRRRESRRARGNADEHTRRPIRSPSSAVNLRDLVSPRGVRFWLVEDYAVPLVALEFAFRGGASQDPAGKAGARPCSPACSTKARAISTTRPSSSALDEKAIELSFHAERDHVSGRMTTLSRHLDRAGELLRLAVNAPRFDEAPIDARARADCTPRSATRPTSPARSPAAPGARACFPAIPIRCRPTARPESLAAVDARRPAGAGEAARHPRGSGDRRRRRDRRNARGEADRRRLRRSADGRRPHRAAAGAVRRAGRGRGRRSRRAADDHPLRPAGAGARRRRLHGLRRARPCAGRRHRPLLAPVPRSARKARPRLFRFRRGRRLRTASYLHGGTTTKNERAYESLEVIRDEILDLARGGISEDELEKGKRYLIGSYPLRFDTSTKIAGQLVAHPARRPRSGLARRAQRAHRRGDDGRRAPRRRTDVRRRLAVGGDGGEAGEGVRRRASAAFQSVNCLMRDPATRHAGLDPAIQVARQRLRSCRDGGLRAMRRSLDGRSSPALTAMNGSA